MLLQGCYGCHKCPKMTRAKNGYRSVWVWFGRIQAPEGLGVSFLVIQAMDFWVPGVCDNLVFGKHSVGLVCPGQAKRCTTLGFWRFGCSEMCNSRKFLFINLCHALVLAMGAGAVCNRRTSHKWGQLQRAIGHIVKGTRSL